MYALLEFLVLLLFGTTSAWVVLGKLAPKARARLLSALLARLLALRLPARLSKAVEQFAKRANPAACATGCGSCGDCGSSSPAKPAVQPVILHCSTKARSTT